MCGIVGIAGPRAVEHRDHAVAMAGTLRHRGPDGDGVATFDGCVLAHRRLAVIDPAGGAQPMGSPDGAVGLTYNGEIYGFVALRRRLEALGHRFRTRSDTEVLLAGWLAWGDDVLHELDGMFAFGLWDEHRKRLLLARDRLGIKPLYWTEVGGRLLFASEPKALLRHPEVEAALDPVALDAYLDLYYVPPPRSMFRGIHQLPPGHRLVWERGRATVERWWDAPPRPEARRTLADWAAETEPVLVDAVLRRTVADVPVGVFLSGGLDSSTIVAILAEHGGGPIETFSVGYGPEGRSYDEREAARVVARHFGTRHHEVQLCLDPIRGLSDVVRAFDEPFGSPTALLSSSLSAFARHRVTVALAGDGGDEVFGGYPRYRGMLWSRSAAALPSPVIDGLRGLLVGREPAVARSYRRWARQFLEGLELPLPERYAAWVGYATPAERDRLLAPAVRDAVARAGRLAPVADLHRAPTRGDAIERAVYADLHGFLPENVLRGSDRTTMAHGVELRVPLCDHRLVELAARVPSGERLGALVGKRILRRIARGRLPTSVLRRRKLGFNGPIGAWLRRDLGRLVEGWLAPDRVRRRGFFDPVEVGRLVAEHERGHRDHGLRLWSLAVVEEWARAWLDRGGTQ